MNHSFCPPFGGWGHKVNFTFWMSEKLDNKVSPPFEATLCTHLLNVSHYLLFTPRPLKGILAL
jgi:hypothetical protein